MSWIKDNLILLLGCLSLFLGLGWILSHYRAESAYAKLEGDYKVINLSYGQAVEANKGNQTTIATLKKTNAELIAQQKLDQQAAADAAARAAQLSATIERQLAENAALREKLAQENPDVRAYLDSGMPCELARSLWGYEAEAGACQN